MQRERTSTLVILVLLVLGAAQLVHYAPRLPETVAVQFGASGAPTSWSPKSHFLTMMASLELLFAALGLFGGPLIRRMPGTMINIPNRDFWLTPERRKETLEFVSEQLAWIEAATLAFVLALGQAVMAAHLQDGAPRLPGSFILILPAFGLALAVIVVRILKKFGRPTL